MVLTAKRAVAVKTASWSFKRLQSRAAHLGRWVLVSVAVGSILSVYRVNKTFDHYCPRPTRRSELCVNWRKIPKTHSQ